MQEQQNSKFSKIKKFLCGSLCLLIVFSAAITLFSCGSSTNDVYFGEFSGSYTHTREVNGEIQEVTDAYTVAASDWTRLADEEGFTQVYKLDAQTIAYDEATSTALEFYNDTNDPKHFVVLKFDLGEVSEQTAYAYTSKLDSDGNVISYVELSNPSDNEIKNGRFILVMGLHESSTSFAVAFDYDNDGDYERAYKFVVDMSEITLAQQ